MEFINLTNFNSDESPTITVNVHAICYMTLHEDLNATDIIFSSMTAISVKETPDQIIDYIRTGRGIKKC